MTTELRVALYSVDPPGLTLFKWFDPESFFVIPAINDALIYIDEDGAVRPALATAWRQLSPTVWEFDLREGVRFHNGEPFDADSVIATFDAHRSPTPSALQRGAFSPIASMTKVSQFRVRLETLFPDVMLLRRLFFMGVFPKEALEREGRDAFEEAPVGTGAYRLARYDRGREIVLVRNPDHWAGIATVDTIRLPIIRQKEWVERLARGEIDAAWNLDSHDLQRALRIPGMRGGSREAAIAQLFLLANRGALADVRVRRALNHAVNRRILVELTEHGLGSVQRGLASRQTEGATDLPAYRYSPDLARRLLDEAGCGPLKLRGLVSETSTALFFAVREFLQRVGVELEAEIVPRATWFQRIMSGQSFDGDFALTACDNPLLHSMFFQFNFFSSHGPGSLTRSPEFDKELISTATDVADPTGALARLERYNHDQALMLYTVEPYVHAAWRDGVDVTLPRSGHFDATAFWKLSTTEATAMNRRSMPPGPTPASPDLDVLLDGTSHTGTFYLRPDKRLDDPTARRIWTNLVESEHRWRVQNEPMMKELVTLVEAKTNLANVLQSTVRVAIVGYSPEGRCLFANRGFDVMFGSASGESVMEMIGDDGPHGWSAIRETVDREGAWLGPVRVKPGGRPKGAPTQLFLTVTLSRDEDGGVIGHTLVFSDFSGEEERIKTAATRTILERVPYGLFVLDANGCMKSGYSDACLNMFPGAGSASLVGRSLTSLLGLDARSKSQFELCYQQVVEDLLPSDVALGQLPKQVPVGRKTFRLDGALVRTAEDAVDGVLFTMLDITEQVDAERETERQKATVAVLRFRDSFETFALELGASLDALISGEGGELGQEHVRALLHTAKGVFGQFALSDLAAEIHRIEDQETIDQGTLSALRDSFHAVLRENRDIWHIELTASAPTYVATEAFVSDLERRVRATRDGDSLRALVLAELQSMREKSAAELLGPVALGAADLAVRRGKASVDVSISGGETRVPLEMAGVLATLVHLVRNAVDHGIEGADERGEKPAVAKIDIKVGRTERELHVVVADDGKGIDSERVVARAVEMGAVDKETAASLTEDERLQLVFVGGLSTSEAVTETSGRGVGVGATKAAVESVGGKLHVSTRRGHGTTFTLVLPIGAAPHDAVVQSAAE